MEETEGISGATILGNGQVAFILDIMGLWIGNGRDDNIDRVLSDSVEIPLTPAPEEEAEAEK
jgi:chemotaxis protein histidine kinase CheA